MKYTAAHWGTYKIRKDKGKGFKLFPFDQDKDPSDIGLGIETAVTSNSRVNKPAFRRGWLEKNSKHKNIKRGEDHL